jgi:hypothetical protein
MRRSETPLRCHARDPADLSFGFRLLNCRSGKRGSADLGGAVLLFGAKRVASNAFAIALFRNLISLST